MRELRIVFNNVLLSHNFTAKYVGVMLDRTPAFKTHASNVDGKLKFRNHIIQKLAKQCACAELKSSTLNSTTLATLLLPT